jgi:hypothetical protein
MMGRVGRSAYWPNHDPSGLVEAGYGPTTTFKAMKMLRMTVLAVGLLGALPVALAQSTMTDGLVIKVDQAAGKITIKHGPLSWPVRSAGRSRRPTGAGCDLQTRTGRASRPSSARRR